MTYSVSWFNKGMWEGDSYARSLQEAINDGLSLMINKKTDVCISRTMKEIELDEDITITYVGNTKLILSYDVFRVRGYK